MGYDLLMENNDNQLQRYRSRFLVLIEIFHIVH